MYGETPLLPAVKKNGKTKSETDVFSMKFDRTDLIIGQSKAKNCEESAGDVRIGVAPQKPSKNMEKRTKFCDQKNFRRQKTKCRESPETHFRKVSWRSALISRGKRSFEIFEFVFLFFFTAGGSDTGSCQRLKPLLRLRP